MSRAFQPHEFAKRAGVTVRALHHYDRLGLLQPSDRTIAGYRLYTDRDLIRLEQIVALKFIGFPLSQIRELLNERNTDLAAVLRQQRESLTGKRDHLARAIAAIERAERVISSGEEPDVEAFRKIIEVIQMQTRKDWMKKYYTDEQLADLRSRWSPEVQAQADADWKELAHGVEAAIANHEDPAGPVGQGLAARRRELLDRFIGGNPGIAEGLRKLFADETNWPENFKRPYSEEVDKFLREASKSLEGELAGCKRSE